MGLFKRKMNNTATIQPGLRPIVPPGQTTIHNHSTGWAAIIAVSFACVLVLLPALWFILVFLFDQMGATRPEREAAFWVVSIPIALIAGWFLKWMILSFLDSWFTFRVEVEKELTRREEVRLLAAQTTINPGRMNEEDYNFARVILAVMMVAYQWLEKEGYSNFPGRWRPWSLAESKKTAEQIGVKISQDKANSVSKWLAEKGVITSADSGQLTPAYPDLSNVRVLIDREFGKPIKLVSPTLRDNRGFRFTE